MPESARERVEAKLAAIARLDPRLRAFITPTPGLARDAADACDRAAAASRSLGPLHGLIIAIKDCIDVGGVRATAGSLFFADRIAATDAEVVRRLKAAGAIVVGTTNLHEFCFGGTTQNEHWGACRNPWDPERIPGGSSGGSAVAVAACMADAALGSDTGGSIRSPAAMTGIAGLRPTHGSVSSRGAFPVSPPLDVIGPMARRVADVARVYAAIAGPDAEDPHAAARAPADVITKLDAGVVGLRIGLPRRFYFDDLPPDIAAPVRAAAATFERLGARLVDIDVPGAEAAPANVQRLIFGDAAALHRERLAAAPERFGRLVRERLAPGLALSAADYADALRWREGFRHAVARLFADAVDLVLTPQVCVHTPRADDERDIVAVTAATTRNSWGWAAAGVPALALPCGFAGDGMPVGLQLAAARWRDDVVLSAGHAFQGATDFHESRPPLASDSREPARLG